MVYVCYTYIPPPLCTDTTVDVNQSPGICPSFNDGLNSWVECFIKIPVCGLTIAAYIPPGPATFDPPRFFRLPSNSFSVIGLLDSFTIRLAWLRVCP